MRQMEKDCVGDVDGVGEIDDDGGGGGDDDDNDDDGDDVGKRWCRDVGDVVM